MPLSEQDIIRRLADGEDPWKIDPDFGCTNPLTGYFPTREVEAEKKRRLDVIDKIYFNANPLGEPYLSRDGEVISLERWIREVERRLAALEKNNAHR